MRTPRRLGLALVVLVGCSGDPRLAWPQLGGLWLNQATVAAGLREALEIGVRNAVTQTSREGGFADDARLRIPLPDSLEGMTRTLRRVGLRSQVTGLEQAMNSAAERASGAATEIFRDVIRSMDLQDARRILRGGDTAATEYFRRVAWAPFHERFQPIVDEKIHQVGLARLYASLITRLRTLPVTLPATPALERYVTDRTMEGLFIVLADEERRIRTDPAARVTPLLQRVFGQR